MIRPVRRLRAALAVLLAVSLVVLSPGLEAPRLFAQVVEGGAGVEAGLPVAIPSALAAPASLSPDALSPSLSAPSALTVAPAPAALAPAALPAAATPEAPKGSAAPAAAAVPADAPVSRTRAGYRVRRLMLMPVAALTGAVHSLPVAGPALSASLVRRAADKRVVLSDYDDTLADWNQPLSPRMIESVRAVRAAGKDFAVISDRLDSAHSNILSVFDLLSSAPADLRAGMYVATGSGLRIYRYDEKGEPARVFEIPPLDEAQRARVSEASDAAKLRLGAEAGTEMHVPSEEVPNPSESWGSGYALMLKVASSKESVVKAAAILQEELAARGMDYKVDPRFAKDPANPPYVRFSVASKGVAAAFIAKALKAGPADVLVLGDNHYAPSPAKRRSWLARLGERLSGRRMPAVGNRTDADMEAGVPGALTLSVGGTADPRMSDGWVLDGRGPDATLEILKSVASKPGRPAPPSSRGDRAEAILHGVMIAAVLAAVGGAFYEFFSAFVEILRLGESLLRHGGREIFEGGLPLLGAFGTLKPGARKTAAKKPAAPTDDDIRAAAASVAAYKGMPWSKTEYNVGYYTTLERLKESGATEAQLELYEKLCAEAPVRGGRFNPWSGD